MAIEDDPTDPIERRLAAAVPDDALDAEVFLGELRGRLFEARARERVSMGRYQLHERIGQGGAGAVYRARDPQLDRDVAIKVMRPELAWAEDLLLVEGQRLAALNHPNVVRVFDVGTRAARAAGDPAVVYVVMELVRGESLRAWLERSPRHVDEIVAVHVAAAHGLAAAHARGIIHRDVKPGNVVVGEDGRVQLLDFGFACLRRSQQTQQEGGTAEDEFGSITGGTPAYMSPEQRRDEPADPRSDQFSFCVMLWECVSGQRPQFDGRGRPLRERGRAIPRGLRRVLERGLSPQPHDRWPSMDALRAALQRPRRTWRTIAVAGGLATTAITVLALRGRSEAITPDDGCTAVAQGMAATWSDERADALTEVIGDDPAAREDWLRTRARLDAWTQTWHDDLTAACVASPDRGELACFEGLSTRLRLQLEELDAGGEAAAAAMQRLSELPSSRPCSAMETACGDDIDGEAAVRLDVLASRGALAEAIAQARAAYEGAAQAPAICSARAALRLGRLEFVQGDVEPAQVHLEAAITAAGGHRAEDLEVMAQAGIALIDLFGRSLGQPEQARRWADRIQGALPQEHPLRPLVDCALGGAETHEGSWATARTLLRGCIAALERRRDVAPRRVGDAYMLLAVVEAQSGDGPAAIAAGRTSIARFEAATSPTHSLLITPLSNLGRQLALAGDDAGAEAALARALSIAEQRLGVDHPAVADTLGNIARVAMAHGDHPRALAAYERALSITQRRYPAWHPAIANAQCALASALITADPGRADAAREHAEAALVSMQRDRPRDHDDRLGCELVLAKVLLAAGHPDRARALLDGVDAALASTNGASASRDTLERRESVRAELDRADAPR